MGLKFHHDRTFVFLHPEQTADKVCINSWRFPKDCTNNCQYEAVWKPSTTDADVIEFVVKQKTSQNSDNWIAIGFSDNNKMVTVDLMAFVPLCLRYCLFNPVFGCLAKVCSLSQLIFTFVLEVAGIDFGTSLRQCDLVL